MGCFLACFGFTKKRKRRKASSKIISQDRSYGRYVPLDSNATVKLDMVEMQNPNASATKFSDKPRESSATKIKKKVRFNLNVKSYEPLPDVDDYDAYLSEGEEKTAWEFNREERAAGTMTTELEFEKEYHPNASSKIIGGSCSSYPANYRYQNCRNSYSEEDEIELDDSDFDREDDDDDDDGDDDLLDSDEEDDNNNKLNSGSMESEKIAAAGLGELGKCKLDQLRNSSSTDSSVVGSNSQMVDSVLNPVENLTQWKAIKAKSRQQQQQQQQQKENIAVLQREHNSHLSTHNSKSSGSGPQYSKNMPNFDHYKAMVQGGIAVEASLSKWLS